MVNPNEYNFKVIAKIRSDFPDKFGIPRQSGLLKKMKSSIVFEPEFRVADALRGLEGFSHLWILWIFSENVRPDENGNNRWSPTVRPPRLGGNKRLGVFATRSSFRPNPVAMSCVKIEEVRLDGPDGPEIIVSGADLMDGTPIVDIKPYLPYADSVPDALGGFAEAVRKRQVQVEFPEALQRATALSAEKLETLTEILAQDPRPAYQNDPERVYGFKFAGFDVKFKVQDEVLTVIDLIQL
ncbi:MAG: tRNA (N6-threonylcarbamoyladenosine(37)-N6)-methyltransferase TrmO [Fibrobacter sp.]|nr:tRNA (N6-threonylcarbamoyladenosine(37)-N6)-methyltransferase TrmO [Fibrobacter sp.]